MKAVARLQSFLTKGCAAWRSTTSKTANRQGGTTIAVSNAAFCKSVNKPKNSVSAAIGNSVRREKTISVPTGGSGPTLHIVVPALPAQPVEHLIEIHIIV